MSVISNDAIRAIGYAYGVYAKASGKTKHDIDAKYVKQPICGISNLTIEAYSTGKLDDDVYSAIMNAGSLIEDEDANITINSERQEIWWEGFSAALI